MSWLDQSELRIGLGCMRLPDDEYLALATIDAAIHAGITAFDTAHAYGAGGSGLGGNERLLARAVHSAGRQDSARIITKGGMTRPGGQWVPDGRAKAIAADCQASLAALDGLPIDLYLLHAPDPRTPWRTSVRALARLVEQGLVRRIGLANVNRRQLDEAIELAPIAAVQVALSPLDDRALRGGVLARCSELGLPVIAHSPLGGPRRAGMLARREELGQIAAHHTATPAEVALAWLMALSAAVVPIPGCRRPETARSAARAAGLQLTENDLSVIAASFGTAHRAAGTRKKRVPADDAGDVVIVMGIPGAGKTRLTASYVERGYVRLNRDERGGSLRALATELDERLSSGVRHVVLDNTYLTRTARSHVVETVERHSLAPRCVWLDTPLAQAQVNLVERLLERFGSLPTPDEIREASRREPWLMLPTSQMRTQRELEPPSLDEGFIAVERVPFARLATLDGQPGVFIGAAALSRPEINAELAKANPQAPHLLFDWSGDSERSSLTDEAARVASVVSGSITLATCPHPGGPPSCWCRPPLPGLPLAFSRAHNIDPARSTLMGCSSAHRTLARTLGARYVAL